MEHDSEYNRCKKCETYNNEFVFCEDCISDLLKEEYQKGFIAGADATGSQMNELKIEEIQKILKERDKEWLICLPDNDMKPLDENGWWFGFGQCLAKFKENARAKKLIE